MKPIDIKSNSYGEYNVHSNEKKLKSDSDSNDETESNTNNE